MTVARSLAHSPTRPLTHSPTRPLTHSPTHPLARPLQPPTLEGVDPSKISRNSQLPKKGKYRQRAHCNVLTEGGFKTPTKPSDVDWRTHFPELYKRAEENNLPPPKVDFLDIGCGFGGMTICLAEEFPDKVTVGMEIRSKVSQYVKDRIAALRAKHPGKFLNASCVWTNTQRFLVQYFEKESIEKMLFLFADPCFKASTHRRRIIQTGLLDEYAYLMKPGGILYTITDVEDLANWQAERLRKHSSFVELTDEEMKADKVVELIGTATEESQKVTRNGGQMFRAVFRRV